MGFVIEWVTNIIMLILFAAILELLLPNSSLQRYVKLVVGLMVLMVMIQPILSVFKTDPEDWLTSVSDWVDGDYSQEETLLDQKKMDIEEGQLAYTSEQVAVQLKREVAPELEEYYEMVPAAIEIEMASYEESEHILEGLKSVNVHLQPASEGDEDEEESNEIVPVQSVVINTEYEKDEGEDLPEQTLDFNKEDIQDFLSAQWQIPKDKIQLYMKGGEDQ
ncbi:stage III sporulation protein AF [Alteribacter populi]|uniref:stage III sporulation protein AF n=1 Tax=Alteribacter populi TaxID=2011011 RepID=UPI000BBB402D|nr:stage III sporulation protein AF [Alteribacter populi]